MSNNTSTEYRITRKVTIIGGVLDAVLAVAKILVGFTAQSQALVADGIHSLSDLATDIMVVLAAKHASEEADEDHPYGHHRIETVASVVLALLLATVAVGICWDSLTRLLSGQQLPTPGIVALVVATVSALSKEGIYHYTLRAAKRIKSKLLRANAWHSRSDALSSLVVMIGLGGTLAGFPAADAIAAMVVSVMIIKVAWDIGKSAADELIDKGLDQHELDRIREIALSVDGVLDVHELRTRKMGSSIFGDLHVHVPSYISVSEGHRIGDEVFSRIKSSVERFDDVLVHVDAEDDTDQRPSSGLPMRYLVEEKVRACCDEIVGCNSSITRLTLHYLGGKLQLEIWLDPAVTANLDDTKTTELKQALLQLEHVEKARLIAEI